jgi:hypothetical protein
MIPLDFKRFRPPAGFLRVGTEVLKTLIMNLIGLLTPLHAPNSRSSVDAVSCVSGVNMIEDC